MRLYRVIGLGAVTLAMTSVAWGAGPVTNKFQCAMTVKAMCGLSDQSLAGIDKNVSECRELSGGWISRTMDVFFMPGSGSMVAVSSGETRNSCSRRKFTVPGGVKDVAVASGKVYMVSNLGRLYFLDRNQNLFEMLKSSNDDGGHYKGITGVSEDGHGGVNLEGIHFDLSPDKFDERLSKNRVLSVDKLDLRGKLFDDGIGRMGSIEYDRGGTTSSSDGLL
jgi:hypothetical protein